MLDADLRDHVPQRLAHRHGAGVVDQGGGQGGQAEILDGRRQLGPAAFEMLIDEAGVQVALGEFGQAEHPGDEVDVRVHALDVVAVERLDQPAPRVLAGLAVADELGQHGVVEHVDLAADVDAAVHPHARAARGEVAGDHAGGGDEAAGRLLGADARLDGPAVEADGPLVEGQRFTAGDAQLPLHQVEPGDHLGDRVLHLQAGVHLQEVEVLLGVHDELDRARVHVVGGARQVAGGLAHALAQLRAHRGRGRLLDHLLVAPLDGAFALAQVDDVAVAVGQHLDLDVARLLDVALDEHAGVVEGLLRLLAAGGQGRLHVLGLADDAHALAAAAGGRLEQDRVAHLLGDLQGLGLVPDGLDVSGDDRHAGILGQLLAGDLVAHHVHRLHRRADEDHAGRLHRLGELGFLGEEAVAGMDGLGAGGAGGGNDLVDHQVGLLGGRGADVHGLVRQLPVQAAAVGVRVDGHRADTQAVAGADDADGDFAAVGDEYFFEHGVPHRGMFPCLRSGPLVRLLSSICRVRMRCMRVFRGKMTSSM